jgi:hypothetical protein
MVSGGRDGQRPDPRERKRKMVEERNRHHPGMVEQYPYSEGRLAKEIERQTAKLPSDLFLWVAVGALGSSLFLHMAGNKEKGALLGQWAAPILILGLYNKIVKVAGSDAVEAGVGQPVQSRI